MRVLLITQARLGSSRLPGKVLREIGKRSLLQIHLERLSEAKKVDKIILATTIKEEDDKVRDAGIKLGFTVYRGSENDVLDRFYQAAKELKPDWVVRITADCPLIDPALVDAVISYAIRNDAQYCANNMEEKFPDGQDVEVFKFECLEKAWCNAKLVSEREHVTPYIRKNYTCLKYPYKDDFGYIRMTVDRPEDFEVIQKVVIDLGINRSWMEYTRYIIDKNLVGWNSMIKRNEGYLKSITNDKEVS